MDIPIVAIKEQWISGNASFAHNDTAGQRLVKAVEETVSKDANLGRYHSYRRWPVGIEDIVLDDVPSEGHGDYGRLDITIESIVYDFAAGPEHKPVVAVVSNHISEEEVVVTVDISPIETGIAEMTVTG